MVTWKISVAEAEPIFTWVLLPVASTVRLSGSLSEGGVESITLTFWVAVTLLLFASFAVQITSVSPSLYLSGASLEIVTGNISVAVAGSRVTGVSTAVASTTTSPCTVMTGFVVSLTVIFCTT